MVILVGTQRDREEERKVSKEDVEQFMEGNGIDTHLETSAKLNENVDELFILVC